MPYVDYHQFSTRYAGAIWDPKAVPVPQARERINWGDATKKLFHPHEYAYLRPRGDRGHDLILHLVNRPPQRACAYNDNRVSPPLRGIKGTIRLPKGVRVLDVYAATAEPTLRQERLDFSHAAGNLSFTVSKLRFWTMVVVELQGKGAWE